MKLLSLLSVLIAGFISFSVHAQCGLTVDAGPDVTFCPGGSVVPLNGNVAGPNVTGFTWSPTTGLDNPNSLTPSATITGPITYTLTAEVFDPDLNLITNGNFESGDSDFTTDYIPGTGGAFGLLSDEGQYVISSNSNLTHNNFAGCADHTGGGNMMVINGSSNTDQLVWCQTVDITPATTYRFSAWLTSVFFENPADLQFTVNGTLLGSPFGASSSTCNWDEFAEEWESDGAATAEICITNQNTSSGGNDFAIDDLFFGPVCQQEDEVTISEVEIEAVTFSPVTLFCDGTTILDGFGSSEGPAYTYLWETANGNIVGGGTTLYPDVDAPGVYILNVFYDDGVTMCQGDQAFVIVNPNNNGPVAMAAQETPITCADPTANISAEGSTTGPDIEYEWTTDDGTIVSGADEFNAVAGAEGFYTLTVTNTTEDCSSTFGIEVIADVMPPEVDIETPAPFSCGTSSQRLDATDSRPANNVTIEWTTTDGNIVAGGDTYEPLIDAPGTYTIRVVDELNGCDRTGFVVVTSTSVDLSGLAITAPPAIDCINASVRLAANEPASGLTYAWTTADGSIVSDEDSPQPLVDGAGTYVLLVTDPGSGCTRADSVDVTDTAAPVTIALEAPDPFTCDRAQITLNAAGTSVGEDITYAWTAADGGSVVTDADSLRPTVAGGGDYTLSVSNALNGCSRDTTFRIMENVTPPVADAGAAFELSCGMALAMLDGSASSQGNGFTYAWTTANGNFSGAVDTLQPAITTAGTYALVVTNPANGCTDTSRVTVGQDNSAPAIMIDEPAVLDCRNGTVSIDANDSDNDPNLELTWTTDDGNFVSGTGGLTPFVDQPGTYTLTLADPANDCPATRGVTVTRDTVTPPADAGAPVTLSCSATAGTLTGADLGPGFSYAWAGTDGPLTGETDSFAVAVTTPGVYYLFATNDGNGCVGVDSVAVLANEDVPAVDIGPGQLTIDCNTDEYTLNEGAANDTGLSYAWTVSGGGVLNGPADGPTVTVNAPGTYALEITDLANGCSASEAVTVTRDLTPPVVVIAAPETLNCTLRSLQLNASGSETGNGNLVSWTTVNGSFVNGTDGASPIIDAAGTYQLKITNPATGCLDSAAVTVAIDTLKPVAAIAPPGVLTCDEDTLMLDATASDNDAEFTWTWGTDDGAFVGIVDDLSPAISAAGTYFLTVRNGTNGCTSADTVTVLPNQDAPVVNPGEDRTLSCVNTTALLGGDAGATAGLEYVWTLNVPGRPTVSGNPQTSVDRPGTYQLLVRNTATGCADSSRVSVVEDLTPPVVEVDSYGTLNCTRTEEALSATEPASGGPFLYRWATANGNITGSGIGPAITVTTGGDYQLLVVDSNNGCRDSITVPVARDTLKPVINIAPPAPLTCRNDRLELEARVLTPGSGFAYDWITADGNLVSGAATPRPTIDAAGTYLLTVVDPGNRCVSSASVTIEREDVPPVISGPSTVELNCVTRAAELTTSVSSAGVSPAISWSTADGNIVDGANSLQPLVDQAGSYELTVRNIVTDCSSTLVVSVSRDTVRPVVEIDRATEPGCNDTPTTLNAEVSGNGPFSYLWVARGGEILGGEETISATVRGDGIYLLNAISLSNGCRWFDTLTIRESRLTDFSFDLRPPGCALPLGAIDFTEVGGGTGPFLYSIDGGDAFAAATVADSLPPGRYDLVVQDANGCELTDEVLIPNAPALELALDTRVVVALGDSYRIDTRTNFADSSLTAIRWTPERDLDCGDCLRPVATPRTSTVYVIEVETDDGCFATDSVEVVVDDLLRVYFPTAFSPNGDGVNDVFRPFGSPGVISAIRDLTIFDRWGEAVYQATGFAPSDTAAGWDGMLNGRIMNPDVFVYSATVEFVDGRVETFKGDVILVR